MKSNKQRRAEIKQQRLDRAARIQAQLGAGLNSKPDARALRQAGLVLADAQALARHNPDRYVGWTPLPAYYLDRPFRCRDCGAEEVWTAKQQKWWYEVAGGRIDSGAVRCRPCRCAHRERRAAAMAGPGADLLGQQSRRLRALAEATPHDAAWAEVESALHSKWWGLRVLALQTLGRWGGERAVARLKLFAQLQPGSRWASWEHQASSAAIQALQGHRSILDPAWAVENYLASRSVGDRHSSAWRWGPLLNALPLEALQQFLMAELARGEVLRLVGLLEVLWLPGNRAAAQGLPAELRRRLLSHPEAQVRQTAARVWPRAA